MRDAPSGAPDDNSLIQRRKLPKKQRTRRRRAHEEEDWNFNSVIIRRSFPVPICRLILLLLLLLVVVLLECFCNSTGSTTHFVHAYHDPKCTRRRQQQYYQFDDCYIPPLDSNLAISEANFVMSHDSATGYFGQNHQQPRAKVQGSDNAATHLYAKNQIGSVYQQLDDGARALDIRPKFVLSRKKNEIDDDDNNDDDHTESQAQQYDVVCHHGVVEISSLTLRDVVDDAVRWCHDNPDELVLILHHNLAWPTSTSTSADSNQQQTAVTIDADVAVNTISKVYDSLGVPYIECSDLYGLTVGETMELAALSGGNNSNGGYLIAMDQHDAYLTSCAKQNWVESQLVTCYSSSGQQPMKPCTSIPPPPKSKFWSASDPTSRDGIEYRATSLSALQDYVLQSSNNDPTNDSNTLGPPANDYKFLPFNEIQAFWQVDGTSAAFGIAHLSSLLDDNTKSHINAYIVEWIYEELLTSPISIVAIDQVQQNGIALLSVLRTKCGQFEDDWADSLCGTALPPPRLKIHRPMSTVTCFVTVISTFALALWIWVS